MESVQQWLVLIGEMTREWMPIMSILLIYLILRRLGKTKKNLTVKLTEPATESEIKEINGRLDEFFGMVDKLYKEHAALRKSKEGALSAMAAIRKDATDNANDFRRRLASYAKKSEVMPFTDRLDTIMREIIPLLFLQLNIDCSGEGSQKPSHADRLNRFVYPKNSIWAVAFQEFQKRASEWRGENTIVARLEFVQKCLQDLGLEMDGVPSRVDTLEEEANAVYAQVDENEAMLKVIRKLPTVEPLLPAPLRVEADLKPKKKTGPKRVVRLADAHNQNIGSTVAELREILFGADCDLLPEMCPGCSNAKSVRIRLVGKYEGQVVGDHAAYMWECRDCNHVFAFTAGITTQQQEAIDKELGKEGIANAIVPPRIGDRHFGSTAGALRHYPDVDQSLVPQWCFRCHTADESKIKLVKQYEWFDGGTEIAYLWTCISCGGNFVYPKRYTEGVEKPKAEADEGKQIEIEEDQRLHEELWPGYAKRSAKFIQEHAKPDHLPLIPSCCPNCNSFALLHIILCGEQYNLCRRKQHDWHCGKCDSIFAHPHPNETPGHPNERPDHWLEDHEQTKTEPEPDTRKPIRKLDAMYWGSSASRIADCVSYNHIPMTCPNCKHKDGDGGTDITLSYRQNRVKPCRGNWWHCEHCEKSFPYPYEKQPHNVGRKLKGDDRGHNAAYLISEGVATKFVPDKCPGCENKLLWLIDEQGFVSNPPTEWSCGDCETIFLHPQHEDKTLQPKYKGWSVSKIVTAGVSRRFVPSDVCPKCEHTSGVDGLYITLSVNHSMGERSSIWHCEKCRDNFTHITSSS